MARFIQETYPVEHAGLTRVLRGLSALQGLDRTISRPVLSALAFIGAPVHGLVGRAAAHLAGLRAARKAAAEDRKLWDLALTDARVMADLSRTMSGAAERHGRQA